MKLTLRTVLAALLAMVACLGLSAEGTQESPVTRGAAPTRTVTITDEANEEVEIQAGVLQYRATTVEDAVAMIRDLGVLVDAEDRAEEFAEFVDGYLEMTDERVQAIPDDKKTEVFFQSMGHMFWTGNSKSSGHKRIVAAGGINIAAGEEAKGPG